MKGAIFAFFGLMLLAGVFADDGNETVANLTKPDVLGLKYDIMKCRINAVISLVQYGENTTNVSDEGLAEKLAADLATLKAYADAKDRSGFNSFVISTLKDDVRGAVFYLKDVKREVAKAGRNAAAQEGRDYFAQVKDERAACIQDVALAFAQENKGEIDEHIAAMNDTIAKLKNKSVDTSELESIRDEAEQNGDKLKGAIDRGNGSDVVDTVREIREQHLHIWARFHIAKLEAIVGAVDEEAAAKGYTAELDSINALLNDASGKVAVGTRYEPGAFEQVKNDLKDAYAKLRDLLKKLRGG